MGKQIDADKLIEHFINKTPNGWLVPICENTSRWSLEGIISEIKHFKPTVKATPKADMVAITETLQPRKGHWIFDGDCLICSKCKKAYSFTGSNFCPNCGADMREVEYGEK